MKVKSLFLIATENKEIDRFHDFFKIDQATSFKKEIEDSIQSNTKICISSISFTPLFAVAIKKSYPEPRLN